MTEDIYKMALHDNLENKYQDIVRVPGGWVYVFYADSGTGGYNVSSCFVPYSEEFKT